jgi:hypothetical protein
MSSTTFDTLGYFEKLKAAGMPEEQAKVVANTMREVVEERLATKADLRELEIRLETRLDIRLAELKNDLLRWVLGIAVGQVAIIVALFAVIK